MIPSDHPEFQQERLDALPETQQSPMIGEVALNSALSEQEKVDQLTTDYSPEELATQVLDTQQENEQLRAQYEEADGKYRSVVEERNRGIHREFELAEKVEELEARLEVVEPLAAKAGIDDLTKLPSRIGITEEFENIVDSLNRFKRRGLKATSLILDLDGFKALNDAEGHPFGDRVLRAVANSFSNRLRDEDFIGRLGGDEFVAFLNDTSPEEAQQVVESLQQALRFEVGLLDGVRTELGVSAGITEINPHEAFDAMYSRADQALLQAKDIKRETGVGNHIVIADL